MIEKKTDVTSQKIGLLRFFYPLNTVNETL